MPVITINTEEPYIPRLRERLADHGISYGMLAKVMGIDASQVSRWFATPEADPRISTVCKVETAIQELRARPKCERTGRPRLKGTKKK